MTKAVGVTDPRPSDLSLSSPRKVAHPVHAAIGQPKFKLHPPRMAIANWGFIGLLPRIKLRWRQQDAAFARANTTRS
jgi:hypothetical protein